MGGQTKVEEKKLTPTEDFVKLLKQNRIKTVCADIPPVQELQDELKKQGIHFGQWGEIADAFIQVKDELPKIQVRKILTHRELSHPDFTLSLYQDFVEHGVKLYDRRDLKRLSFIAPGNPNNAVFYYRVELPGFKLWEQYSDLDISVNLNFSKYDIERGDVVIINRFVEGQLGLVKYLKSIGKKVVFDIDDILLFLSPVNPLEPIYRQTWVKDELIEVIASADLVTTTTEDLKKEMLVFNPNVVVLRNKIDLKMPIWNVPKQKKEPGDPVVVLWVGGCYDDKTDVLTKNGWKAFKDVLDTDEIATLDSATNQLEYQLPTKRYEYDYDGKLFSVDMHHASFAVTPNHQMYVNRHPHISKSEWKYSLLPANECAGKSFGIQRDCKWVGVDRDYEIIDDFVMVKNNGRRMTKLGKKIPMDIWLKFFGFWTAEGWTSSTPTSYQVGISNNNKAIIDELAADMTSCGFRCRIEMKGQRNYNLRICNKPLWIKLHQFGGAREKSIPQSIKELSSDKLRLFLKWYVLGGGDKSRMRCYTVSKSLRDDLQEIALKCGYAASFNKRIRGDFIIKGRVIHQENCVPCYTISFTKHCTKPLVVPKRQKWVDYTGKVYCVEVPNHVIYVRRNGIPMWCGNSTHKYDLMLVNTQIIRACSKPGVVFRMCGYTKGGKTIILDEHGKAVKEEDTENSVWDEITGMFSQLGNNLQVEGSKDIGDYPLFFVGADIVLAPLEDNRFNRAKSELKTIEAGAAGLPVICSNVEPYRMLAHGVDGFLADNANKFGKYLNRLIGDENLRNEMGMALRKKIEKNYDAANQEDRRKVYMNIFD